MRLPLDLLPMALCGLATIVAVAVILVASDLLRRLVLTVIHRVERRRAAPQASPHPGKKRAGVGAPEAAPEETVSRSETIPG